MFSMLSGEATSSRRIMYLSLLQGCCRVCFPSAKSAPILRATIAVNPPTFAILPAHQPERLEQQQWQRSSLPELEHQTRPLAEPRLEKLTSGERPTGS